MWQASHVPTKRSISRVPTPSDTRKATRRGALSQAPRRPGVVADPGMCRHSLFGNREVSWLTKAACRDWSASGRRGAEADDARPREVRLRHSSGEVAEQNRATGSGGDGAKGGGRGECEPALHVPDTAPGKRATDAGAHTESRKVSPSLIPGGSRMRESCKSGSVRGALSNERPYRDRLCRV